MPGLVEDKRGLAPTTDAVVVADAETGRIIFSNRLPGLVVGRRVGDMADEYPIFHIDGRRYAPSELQLARTLATGEEIVEEEFFLFEADGSRTVHRCSCSPLFDEGGRVAGAVSVAHDVTRWREEEKRLSYLAGLLDDGGIAVVAFDSEWFVTLWSRGAELMYGWAAEDALGRHETEMTHLDMSTEEHASTRQATAEGGRWQGDVTAYRKDGRSIDVDLTTLVVRDRGGRSIGFLAIHRDVSARKRAEESRRADDQRTRAIIGSIVDSFMAIDGSWRITELNARALHDVQEEVRGNVTREDVLGRRLWDFFPGRIGSEYGRRLHDAMRDRDAIEFETYLPAGAEWITVRLFPSDGGLAIYTQRISERKLAEAERDESARRSTLVAALGLQAIACDDLDALLDEAAHLVARTLGLDLVGVVELLPEDQLRVRAGFGWKEGLVGAPTTFPGPEGLIAHAVAVGTPVTSEDVFEDDRFKLAPVVAEHLPVSTLTVTIAGRDAPFGALAAFSRHRRSFTAPDVIFIQGVANVLGTAIQRLQGDLAIIEIRDAERRRIARDLHDVGLQELAAASAIASDGLPGSSNEDRVRIRAALKRVGERVRAAVYDLRLDEEENRPFAELLDTLVTVQAALAGEAELRLQLRDGVPGDSLGKRGTEVLRIVTEALTNARRHAGAELITVAAWGSRELLCVEVADDGRGFDTGRYPSGDESGIAGMRQRAGLIDADIAFESPAGGGTVVSLQIPLESRAAAGRRVQLLLVEDHAAVREALAAALEREPDLQVVGQAASIAEARGRLTGIEIAIVDLALADGFGGDLIRELHRVNRRAQAIALTAKLDQEKTALAVESGAAAAIDKAAHLDEVVRTVRRLHAGEAVLPGDEVIELLRLADRLGARERKQQEAVARLTPREIEVLRGLADGLDSAAIAARLHITVRTERNHVANILAKLRVHSRLQAVIFAVRHRVVEIR